MATPEVLIVVLPGMGGTCLAVAGRDGRPRLKDGEPEWVWSAGLGDVGLLRNTDRLSIATHPRLAPVGLIPTRKAFGLFTVVHGYDDLVQRLGAAFGQVDNGRDQIPNLDAAVVAQGYDFRLGVADAAEHMDGHLRARLKRLWPREEERRARIVFVAHSMGGLVARYWAAVCGGGPYTRSIITLGTPHRGSPKALEVMANGVPVGPGHLRSVIRLAREWRGVADLLPRYPLVEPPHRAAPDGASAQDAAVLRPHEVELDWLQGPATAGWETHQRIEQGWRALEAPPAMIPRIGFGHGTHRSLTLDGSVLKVSKKPVPGPALGGWDLDRGDGTVPAVSALPLEMDNCPPRRLRTHLGHMAMVTLAEIEDLVRDCLGHRPPTAYRDPDQPVVSLGVDMDDVAEAGLPVRVEATVWRVRGDASEHVADARPPDAWVTVRHAPGAAGNHAPLDPVRMTWGDEGGVLAADLPPLTPGLYDVTVTARSVTDLPAELGLEVVDGDQRE